MIDAHCLLQLLAVKTAKVFSLVENLTVTVGRQRCGATHSYAVDTSRLVRVVKKRRRCTSERKMSVSRRRSGRYGGKCRLLGTDRLNSSSGTLKGCVRSLSYLKLRKSQCSHFIIWNSVRLISVISLSETLSQFSRLIIWNYVSLSAVISWSEVP
jgi:hypothetical protein